MVAAPSSATSEPVTVNAHIVKWYNLQAVAVAAAAAAAAEEWNVISTLVVDVGAVGEVDHATRCFRRIVNQ